MVLVVSPLVAIMKDRMKIVQSLGVTAVYAKRYSDTDDKIAAGKYSIVY